MRKLAIIILIMLLTSPALAIQNDPDGFRDLSWGTSRSDIDATLIFHDEIDLGKTNHLGQSLIYEVYMNNEEQLSLGGIDLGNLLYLFYDNKLWGVIALLQNADDFFAARHMLELRFGNVDNQTPTKGGAAVQWTGKKGVVSLERSVNQSIIFILSKQRYDLHEKIRMETINNDF